MSITTITPGFAYINVIVVEDAANVVYLVFQRVAPNGAKYLSIHTEQPDGTPSKLPLLENRDMYEPRGIRYRPDGTAVVYGASRDRSHVLEVDIPGFKASVVRPLDLSAPWVTYGSPFAPPTLHTVGGLVTLQGVLRGTGTNALEVPLCVLPVGCRPSTRLAFPTAVGLNFALAAGRVDVCDDGRVLVGNKDCNWVSLSGVVFAAAATP